MIARIVVANQAEARFYDAAGIASPLRAVGQLENPDARLHDRDLKSDRPGRVFTSAAAGSGRRGAVAHHATGGEKRPRQQVATVFARRIAAELSAAKQGRQFDRLVLIVAPSFLGTLRKALPKSLQSDVVAEIAKDLQDPSDAEVREHLPGLVFQTVP
ncbi:MAG: host attachment protein [Steroidobacteraceae bacterium]